MRAAADHYGPPLSSLARRQAGVRVTPVHRLFRGAAVDDLPDPPALVVGDVQGSVRPLGQPRRTVRGFGVGVGAQWSAGESVGKDFVLGRVGRFAPGEWNEGHVISLLCTGRAVPGSVESDERTVL